MLLITLSILQVKKQSNEGFKRYLGMVTEMLQK